MFDEWSSFLSAVLYVNLIPTAWLLLFFCFFHFGAELMHYSSGLRRALCASGIGGSGWEKKKKNIKEGKEAAAAVAAGRQKECRDSCTTPSFFFFFFFQELCS